MKSLKDISKKIGRGLTALALVGSLSGCGETLKYGTYEGNPIEIGGIGEWDVSTSGSVYQCRKGIRMYHKDRFDNSNILAWDNDEDGRLDEMRLVDIYKGDPLEEYANIISMQKAYDTAELSEQVEKAINKHESLKPSEASK